MMGEAWSVCGYLQDDLSSILVFEEDDFKLWKAF